MTEGLQYLIGFRKKSMNAGIEAIEIYIPRTYVDQSELEKHFGVKAGKYTVGLGQLQMSFAGDLQDVNSLCLTAVSQLMRNNNIQPHQVGRLQVGTQTLLDKSKSTKTVLMSLFPDNADIEGASSINACYGATNALINTLNWVSSPSWDGRFGIVVAADLAVYEEGPARPTGGAGAVAMLISRNPKILINPVRASHMEHQYDFYKPVPSSQYPTVDGQLSLECYLRAMKNCYLGLKRKRNNAKLEQEANYLCFHTPFAKMVQKAYTLLLQTQNPQITSQEILNKFQKKVEPSLFISKRVGNIYTGSLYAGLFSLLYRIPTIANSKVLLFSYGSGLCSTMLEATILQNPLSPEQILRTDNYFRNRIKVSAADYSDQMLKRQKNFGKFKGKPSSDISNLDEGAYYLTEIDQKWRRHYKLKPLIQASLTKNNTSNYINRIKNIDKKITDSEPRFYKMSIGERREALFNMKGVQIDQNVLQQGGLISKTADSMIENVIGKLSLPLAVLPAISINQRQYTVPMCIQEPSVVAAASAIGKFMAPFSFHTSSSPTIMIGQVHLPNLEPQEVNMLTKQKFEIMKQLNKQCQSMVGRGGGIKDIRVRELQNKQGSKDHSMDVLIDVCQAMGANITNTVAEKAKEIVARMGINTGISVLSNYCIERRAVSQFIVPVQHMAWKGSSGAEVVRKILQAYQFARNDTFRAVTHNKGIMNGIDAVCLATGQDWRAVQAAAHAFASKTGKYQPLTHYQLIEKEGKQFFKGIIELPMAVGTVGGVVNRNPIYKYSLSLLGQPSSQELAEIIVTIGLAQNLGALRALAIEGIQRGHMRLHARAIAVKLGVPSLLLDECCRYMEQHRKYDQSTVSRFLEFHSKPRL